MLRGREPRRSRPGVRRPGLPVLAAVPDPRAGRGGLRRSGTVNISTPAHPALRLGEKKNVRGGPAPPFQRSGGVHKGC